jgi:hypothetical protein
MSMASAAVREASGCFAESLEAAGAEDFRGVVPSVENFRGVVVVLVPVDNGDLFQAKGICNVSY